MFRNILFFSSVIAVISVLFNIILIGAGMVQSDSIRSLEGAMSALRDDIVALEGKSTISCADPVLMSSAGKPYARVSAAAGKDGKVTLVIKNLHDDSIFAINIREVTVGYDRALGRIAADYRTAQTFKEAGGNSTCSGVIDPGDSLSCESTSFRDAISMTMENGDDTFMISDIAVELDMKPYYFVASGLCVGIS